LQSPAGGKRGGRKTPLSLLVSDQTLPDGKERVRGGKRGKEGRKKDKFPVIRRKRGTAV